MGRGLAEWQRNLQRIAKRFPEEIERALTIEAKIELKEAQRRVPYDTGKLHDSGKVLPPIRTQNRILVPIIFDAPYAVYVHEDPDAFHPNGQWKFLESVLNESAPHMAERVAKRVRLDKII